MAIIDDIGKEKDAAVAVLEKKIGDALDLKNAGEAGMDPIIHDLMTKRVAVFLQAYTGALESEEMQKALTALKAATADMSRVAAEMKKAAEFIAKAAKLLGGADKAIAALQGKA